MRLCKRPHFHLRGDDVFFLNAPRPLPALSPAALDLLRQVVASDGVTDPDASDAVTELTDRGICDLIAPIEASARKPVLVIEPHGDDAALSIGGVMWQRRMDLDFTLVTLASRSNYTSSFHTGRDFFERDAVSELRRAEGAIFMDHLGGQYRVLGLLEATMRYEDADWSVDFFKAHRTSVAINNNRMAPPDILARWIEALSPVMCDAAFEEIWIPIGAGTHADHDLTRNAALSVLIAHPEIMERAQVRLYKDVPYGTDFPAHTDRLVDVLTKSGAVLEANDVDVTDALDRKLELLGIFASQFKIAHVRPGVQRSAAVGGADGQSIEHLWHLKKIPDHLDTGALFIETPAAEALRGDLEQWTEAGAAVRKLEVLALAASGRWTKDEAMLRDMFPNAQITVYASPVTHAEIALRKGADVTLKPVGRGAKPWVLLALRLALSARSHRLFVAGDRVETARKLAKLWPFHRTLVVQAMDHVALAGDTTQT